MQNFSKSERIAAALYFIWFFVQLGLFFYSDQSPDNVLFWPFTSADKSMIVTYDVTEFAVYTAGPLVLFIAYRIMSGKDYEGSQGNRRHSFTFFVAFLDERIKAEELAQKLNEVQNKPVDFHYLNEIKKDREIAASQSVNNWLDRVEVRKKYKQFES
ncbi:MAG TPA: hypothetical protein PLY34_12855 [Ferruginibacter sp.]|nr:hypothetical protein [Ferruginibacter sp.]HPH89953.1 hypothetical protein [Ferruginibacter sp.]